jgi:hypothetical protein
MEDESLDPESESAVDMQDVKQALDLQPIAVIQHRLSQPIKARHIAIKEVDGTKMAYISWHMVCQYLDYLAPGWTWTDLTNEVIRTPELPTAGIVVTTGTLTIVSNEGGHILRTARQGRGLEVLITKKELEGKRRFGDPMSNSESMALRRAAAKFGLAREWYNKDAAAEAVRAAEACKTEQLAKARQASRGAPPNAPRTATTPHNGR